jgi:cytochrome bd ubiquinol oxidase subunit I
MHYPWWHVAHLTAPMLIAIIATVHVLVSHYAVGGGLFLAVELRHAYRTKDREYLDYLKRHAGFFILVTVVFGAITGVGIWWTIGLASPLATELLIRTFVFGWATEWVFFVIELAAAFIVYYCWGKLAEKTHVAMAGIYAFAAWMSLVLITGITAFMANPGGWLEKSDFWTAFFNPQFIPQTVARTGGALLLTSLYVYLHASLVIKDCRMRDMIGSRSARPALAGAIMITVGGLGWYWLLPASAKVILEGVASLNILIALIFVLTIITFFLLYLGPYRNPGWLSPGFAGALFIFGLAAFSTGEFIREAVRKPYVIYNVVLGNQITPDEVPKYRQQGYLNGGIWTKAFVAKTYPQAMADDSIDENKLLELPAADRVHVGQLLFEYHCNDCHAAGPGFSAVSSLMQGRSRDQVRNTIEHLDTYFFMPPWAGNDAEAELLTDYLMSIAPSRPAGMRLGSQPSEVK